MTANNVVTLSAPKYARVGQAQIEHVIAALARGGTLASACAEAGASYAAVFMRAQRDENLAAQIDEAKAKFHSKVIATAHMLGIEGVEVPVFDKDGNVIAVRKKWSERILLRLLGAIPEFRESKAVEHKGEVTHTIEHRESNALPAEVYRTLPFSVQYKIRRAIVIDAYQKNLLTVAQAEEKLADAILDARERGEPISDERAFLALSPPSDDSNIVDAEVEMVEVEDAPYTDEEVNFL